MPSHEIIVTDVIDEAELKAIEDGLNQFNDDHVGYGDRQPLAVYVRDQDSGEFVGGAVGRSSLGLLFLDLLFLPKTVRGKGMGAQILQRFEEEGRRRGCKSAVVYTISFQAPEFYVRHGWTLFGTIPCDPPGTSRVFLSKALNTH